MNAAAMPLAAAVAGLLFSLPAAAQDKLEQSIVYIECAKAGQTSRGTGVIVSAAGHVLTAKHVVPDGATCKGSAGVADPNSMKTLVSTPATAPVDATLLRFLGADTYRSMTYCSLEDWMVRKRIFVAGFPVGTQTGAASYRQGVLSTVFPNSKGIIETDGQTISGMSGGPVFSSNLRTLVGIVIGADFAPNGSVSYYGILPVSDLAQLAPGFNLTKSPAPCFPRSREATLPPTIANWNADKPPLPLGVGAEEGMCFITGIRGDYNHAEDRVAIEIQNGEYVLVGVNKGGGEHGASVRCIWFE